MKINDIVEELLKVRFKVIADYPGSQYKIGDLISMPHPDYDGGGWIKHHNKYPHLFKKLEWHEDREEKDMPQYVKCIRTPDQIHFPDNVYKMEKDIIISTNCYLPATLEEFNNQNKKQ